MRIIYIFTISFIIPACLCVLAEKRKSYQ
uniref:Uncharacterized protein n=1 Tax=Anguilla anguilla TaxID=7936 RepID=A0A0E9UMH0_ANGAN